MEGKERAYAFSYLFSGPGDLFILALGTGIHFSASLFKQGKESEKRMVFSVFSTALNLGSLLGKRGEPCQLSSHASPSLYLLYAMNGSELFVKVQGPALSPHQQCNISSLLNYPELQL